MGGTRIGSVFGSTIGRVSSAINSVPAGKETQALKIGRTDAEAAVVKMAALDRQSEAATIPEARLLQRRGRADALNAPLCITVSGRSSTSMIRHCKGTLSAIESYRTAIDSRSRRAVLHSE